MYWEPKLQELLTHSNLSTEEKISHLLELGLDVLGLGIGIVSHVEGETYSVLHASSPGDMIEPGATFPVGETYCCHTLRANDSVGFHHAAQSEIATHPCYAHFKLESYIGAPIHRDGVAVGTVNFSAAAPRDPFTEEEFQFIETLARWIGAN